MKAIQKISTSTLIMVASLALSACGGGDDGASGPSPSQDASNGGGGGGTSGIQKLSGVNGFKVLYQTTPQTYAGSITSPIT